LNRQYIKLFDLDGIQLEFDDSAAEAVAALAIERNTGARGLRSIFENAMMGLMYELPGRTDVKKVVITGDFINGKAPAQIITK
jgi:ATP-dependent Clp protease ATP-binding subunit ClpX